jgi:hypothetical protein
MTVMRCSGFRTAGLATTIGLILLLTFSARSMAQTAAVPGAPQVQAPGLQCNGSRILDPFKGSLAGPNLSPGVLPVDAAGKDISLKSGLPCQENVSTGAQGDQNGKEPAGLQNLQRGFDFYSWRTFIALNSPADGTPIDDASVQADTPTRWEDMNNFKQLLDVMLPADLQPPQWPADPNGMTAERERLVPQECKALHQQPQNKNKSIVKMIEESFNEPFKTGPLIDQQGHYAIFDILMNREMFGYIMEHHLNTKAGQMRADNAGLLVDFRPGQNAGATLGAFMLKVSWKILTEEEKAAKNFHMVDALVLMPPPDDPTAERPCLPETLGLVGFHAVHKTVNRPQWIWTSFEHVKNVPARDEVTAKKLDGPYNFFSVACKDYCPDENATPPRPWDPDPALKLSFRRDNSFKSQIVRETPLTDATKNMNAIFHSMLPNNSVWQNYMLISTQWPSAVGCTSLHSQNPGAPDPKTDFLKRPDMTCSPAPTFLANSTLETYSQGDVPVASSSCIACHGNAVGFQTGASNPVPAEVHLNQSDFTFMLEKAQ